MQGEATTFDYWINKASQAMAEQVDIIYIAEEKGGMTAEMHEKFIKGCDEFLEFVRKANARQDGRDSLGEPRIILSSDNT